MNRFWWVIGGLLLLAVLIAASMRLLSAPPQSAAFKGWIEAGRDGRYQVRASMSDLLPRLFDRNLFAGGGVYPYTRAEIAGILGEPEVEFGGADTARTAYYMSDPQKGNGKRLWLTFVGGRLTSWSLE